MTAEPKVATTTRLRVPAIDGFRGYAAITVVLFHVIYAAGSPPLDEGIIRSVLVSGYMGVDFFFVISGFVLFLPAVTNHGSLGDQRAYLVRRAARILPAFYVVMVAVVVLHPLISSVDVPLPLTSFDGTLSFVLHLLFLHHSVGLLLGFPEGFAVIGAVWTLCLEAVFYVILPLVAGWYYRRPLLALVLALATATAWKIVATHVPFGIPWNDQGPSTMRLILVTQLPTYFGHFAAGMTAAWAFARLRDARSQLVTRLAVPAQVVALITVIAGMRAAGIRDLTRPGNPFFDATGRFYYEHWTGTTLVGIAFAALLLATALAPRWAQAPWTNPVARRLGDVSYGVYLWHLIVIYFALQTLNFAPDRTGTAFFRMLSFTLAGTLVLAGLSFVLVERPCIRWAQRWSRKSSAVITDQPRHQTAAL